jgi:hypothetical protein
MQRLQLATCDFDSKLATELIIGDLITFLPLILQFIPAPCSLGRLVRIGGQACKRFARNEA